MVSPTIPCFDLPRSVVRERGYKCDNPRWLQEDHLLALIYQLIFMFCKLQMQLLDRSIPAASRFGPPYEGATQ
jgi:hypothetical protein